MASTVQTVAVGAESTDATVAELTATTKEMSRNAAESAGGTEQITFSINDVAASVTVSSQTLEQTRSTIDDLARMATDLRRDVTAFIV